MNTLKTPGEVKPSVQATHFHSSDNRFCGNNAQVRRFTTDPNQVTCEDCKARDTFTLSNAGRAYVEQIQ